MQSELFLPSNIESDKLVVSFGGVFKAMGGIPPFEFQNIINSNFNYLNSLFYIDIKQSYYQEGIGEISNDIESFINYLKNKIEPYKHVTFVGVSAGGYAASLFGSILEVNQVLTFVQQSFIDKTISGKYIDKKYRDVLPFLNDKTQYHLYRDPIGNGSHAPSQIDRLNVKDNVHVYNMHGMVKEWHKRGELVPLLANYFNL